VCDWLVITADQAPGGRGIRGHALAWFLRTYFGRRAVGFAEPAHVRERAVPRSEFLFIGLPSSLAPNELRRLIDQAQPRLVVPFDYLDRHDLAWTAPQEAELRGASDRYFKPWFESAWTHHLRMGVLPLRDSRRRRVAVTLHRAARRLGRRNAAAHEVCFFGRPNRTSVFVDGAVRQVDQRVQWLLEIKRQAPELHFVGGLTGCDEPQFHQQESLYGDLSDLRYQRGQASFATYWQAMRRSRVALAPGGNVPWTYRHYEALYSGAVVVTVDYRRRDMLIPLPVDLMVHVPDGGSVLPAVREALELCRRHPKRGDEVYAHLERYLAHGAYSRRRPALIERFLAQLE
jgi:hypothetical protein